MFIHFIYAKFQKKKLEIPNTNDSDIFCRSETYILLLERKAKLMIIDVLALLSPCFVSFVNSEITLQLFNVMIICMRLINSLKKAQFGFMYMLPPNYRETIMIFCMQVRLINLLTNHCVDTNFM